MFETFLLTVGLVSGGAVGYFLGLKSKANETYIHYIPTVKDPNIPPQGNEPEKPKYNEPAGDPFYMRQLERLMGKED